MMLIITCSVSENRRMFCLCLVIGSKPLILELGGLIKNPHAHLSTSIYLTVNPTDSLFIYISTSHRRIVIFFASMRNTTFPFVEPYSVHVSTSSLEQQKSCEELDGPLPSLRCVESSFSQFQV